MQKIIIIWLCLLLLTPSRSIGCDVCGCGLSSNYAGIMPQYKANSLGVRFSSSKTQSKHLPSLFGTVLTSTETFKTAELIGRYYVNKRWLALGMLPFHQFNKSKSDGNNTTIQGIGDANLLLNYIVFNNSDSQNTTFKQLLQFGGGVKLVTGNYSKLSNNEVNPNFQLGTGAYSFVTNALYTIKKNNIGFTAEASFIYNLTNKNSYMFGSKQNISGRLFYWKRLRKFSLIPAAGMWFEHGENNIENNTKVKYSGGSIANFQPGIDAYFKHFSIGMLSQIPIAQNLSTGLVKQSTKHFITLNYIF